MRFQKELHVAYLVGIQVEDRFIVDPLGIAQKRIDVVDGPQWRLVGVGRSTSVAVENFWISASKMPNG